jgi:hypothetical protein
MSRITSRPPVSTIEDVTSTTYDARFLDFENASLDLDENNHRDGAVDLPQVGIDRVVVDMQDARIGANDLDLVTNTFIIYAYDSTNPAPWTPVHIDDPTAVNPSYLSWPAGLTPGNGDVMRVSWHIDVNVEVTGSPSLGGDLGLFKIPDSSGPGNITFSDGWHAFIIYLEWDVTDNTLTSWQPVSGQTDYSNTIPGAPSTGIGGYLSQSQAATFVPCKIMAAFGADDGEASSVSQVDVDWHTIRGTWLYAPNSSAFTIYGMRLVVQHGLYHPSQSGTNASVMIADENATSGTQVGFRWQTGRIMAVTIKAG